MNKVNEIFLKKWNSIFLKDLSSNVILTYSQLYCYTKNLGIFLNSIGIKKNNKILIISDNSFYKVIIFFCALFSNYHIILGDLKEKKLKEVNEILTNLQIQFLILDKKSKNILFKNKHKGNFFVVKLSKNNFKSYKIYEINKILKKRSDEIFKKINFNKFSPYLTILTSGTTGKPKGITHNASSLINSALNFNIHNKINEDCVMAHLFSMNYMAGILNTIFCPFISGGKVILFEKFSPLTSLNFWERAQFNKINYMWLAPTMLQMLIDLDRYKHTKSYCKKYIKKIFVGTGPFFSELKNKANKVYFQNIYESYGTTELLFISCENSKNKTDNSSGKILPNVYLKFSKKKEIVVKTNSKYLGIMDFEKGKMSVKKSVWNKTGDLGKITKNLFLVINGRLKDIIIKGGINIYPQIIENILLKNKFIKNLAVIGVKNKFYGEEVVVFYSLREKINQSKIEKELLKICKRNLDINYIPDRFINKDFLEVTKTGKIRKNAIKENYLK